MVEARVHERHVQGGRLAAGGPAHGLLRDEPVPHGVRAVHGQLGEAGGARAVGDEGGVAGVEADGGRGRGARVLLQRFGAGGVVDRERAPYEAGEFDVLQGAFELRPVGDQPGPVEAFEELSDHRARESGRQQDGDGADTGDRAGQQHDVDVVRLVDDHFLGGADARFPEAAGEFVDHVGEGGVGEVGPEAGVDVERPVQGDEDMAVTPGGLGEHRTQVEPTAGEGGLPIGLELVSHGTGPFCGGEGVGHGSPRPLADEVPAELAGRGAGQRGHEADAAGDLEGGEPAAGHADQFGLQAHPDGRDGDDEGP